MPASSLFDLAKTRLIQNIPMLQDVGDLPYSFLAPILRHIQNPDQLLLLETNCPHLRGETPEIWRRFIARDIPNYEKIPHQPHDPKNWSKVYRKLKRDAEREEQAQREALKQQMQALKKERVGHQTTIIEGQIKEPGGKRRFGFGLGGGGGGGSWGGAGPAPPTKTGKAAFDKLRRGIFDQKQARPKAAMMPTHLLAERKKMKIQAPARMVRMQETDAPRRMMLSKEAASSVTLQRGAAAGALPVVATPALKQGKITSRPVPRVAEVPPPKERARLPEGQQFTAPRPQQSVSGAVAKRKREQPSILQPLKRRAM